MMDLFRSAATAPPLSLPGMGDHAAALTLFGAIMLGLYRRALTGRGAHVRSSLMANGVWANAVQVQAMLCGATVQPRPSREQAPNALANRYATRDGRWFLLTLLRQERDWERLLRAIGREDLERDARFATAEVRRVHAQDLVRVLDEVFAQRNWAEWRQVLRAHDLTFEAVHRLEDLRADGQLTATGTFVPLADDAGLLTVASPLEMVGIPKRAPGRAPALGQHTGAILRELGYDDGNIERLQDQGAFGPASLRSGSGI
jgi:crotonobetainyl-CoA:carnitine CoA-transferase CaiB-like acyl-CoA transferase